MARRRRHGLRVARPGPGAGGDRAAPRRRRAWREAYPTETRRRPRRSPAHARLVAHVAELAANGSPDDRPRRGSARAADAQRRSRAQTSTSSRWPSGPTASATGSATLMTTGASGWHPASRRARPIATLLDDHPAPTAGRGRCNRRHRRDHQLLSHQGVAHPPRRRVPSRAGTTLTSVGNRDARLVRPL